MELTPQEQYVIETIRGKVASLPYNEHYFSLHIVPMDGDDSHLITLLALEPKPIYGMKRDLFNLLQNIKKDADPDVQHLLLTRFETGIITCFGVDAHDDC